MQFEKLLRCRIYHALPRGTDLLTDLRFSRHLDALKTVFDIGANEGQTTVPLATILPRAQIHAFEPVTATRARLLANTRRFPGVRVHPFGFGSVAEQRTISLHPQYSECHSLHRPAVAGTEQIELRTLDGFLKETGIGCVDLLKIDTEGHDLEVLRGATTALACHRIHCIQVEASPERTHDCFVPYPDFLEFLGGFDYRLYGIYGQQCAKDHPHLLLFFNLVFICPAWANTGWFRAA